MSTTVLTFYSLLGVSLNLFKEGMIAVEDAELSTPFWEFHVGLTV